MNINEIIKYIQGNVEHIHQTEITNISVDSRNFNINKYTLFFVIKGENNDGHLYIEDAYKKGVRNFVIEKKISKKYDDANFIQVKNTIQALQKITQKHREKFNIPIIGITGSNGKTITKEWIYQTLFNDYNIIRNPKSYNSQVGVPLSIWQINDTHQLGIFEAGISQMKEMEKLQKIIQPTIGIFTNIGTAHSENFVSNDEKIIEKLKLFKDCKTLIFSNENPKIKQHIEHHFDTQKIELLNFGKNKNSTLQILNVNTTQNQSHIELLHKDEKFNIVIPFTDKGSIDNSITVSLLLLYFNFSKQDIIKKIQSLKGIEMRLEQKKGLNNCTIINDSYNSDLQSIKISIDFLNQQNNHSKKSLIISDLLQQKNSKELYQNIANTIQKGNIEKVYGVGKQLKKYATLFDNNFISFENTEQILSYLKNNLPKNETILLKGSREFTFEKISKILEYKKHNTVLEINLNALIHNLNYHRKKIKPTTKIMIMVKAYSYGNGDYEIAKILQHHRIDYLGVACTDEGISLRENGISLPILVMNPEIENYDNLINYQLEPEIYSLRGLNEFLKIITKNPIRTPYPIHLKIDTGMHRLGFEQNDIEKICNTIQQNPHIKVKSIFSHLAESDNIINTSFTEYQIDLFKKIAKQITNHLNYPIIKHILNSSGIVNFTQHQMDMVRLGIGLYGISSNENTQKELKNISTLKTVISQIKQIQPNESIGYNRNFINNTKNTITIATIPIGYADGISRMLGNGNTVFFVNGKPVKTIGNICMDMTIIDISNIYTEENDEVIIFKQSEHILQIAKQMNTIPYEIFTNISQRIKRVYVCEE